MIRKLKSGEYRLYSRKKNPKTGKRRNLGTFSRHWRKPRLTNERYSISSVTDCFLAGCGGRELRVVRTTRCGRTGVGFLGSASSHRAN